MSDGATKTLGQIARDAWNCGEPFCPPTNDIARWWEKQAGFIENRIRQCYKPGESDMGLLAYAAADSTFVEPGCWEQLPEKTKSRFLNMGNAIYNELQRLDAENAKTAPGPPPSSRDDGKIHVIAFCGQSTERFTVDPCWESQLMDYLKVASEIRPTSQCELPRDLHNIANKAWNHGESRAQNTPSPEFWKCKSRELGERIRHLWDNKIGWPRGLAEVAFEVFGDGCTSPNFDGPSKNVYDCPQCVRRYGRMGLAVADAVLPPDWSKPTEPEDDEPECEECESVDEDCDCEDSPEVVLSECREMIGGLDEDDRRRVMMWLMDEFVPPAKMWVSDAVLT